MKTNESLAISAMSELPSNKQELLDYNELIKQSILSGNNDVLEVARKINILKRIAEFFEKDKDIQEVVLNEASKFSNGELKEIQVKELGTKYYFEKCGHSIYNRLVDQRDSLNASIKALEEGMKLTGGVAVDPLTGEEFTFNKAAKSSTTKVVFTLK